MAIEKLPPLLSYDDCLRLLPAEARGEVIEGEWTVTPSPSPLHQQIVGTLARHLGNFLADHPELGRVFVAPLDVVLRAERPAIVLQPALMFISAAREDIIQDVVRGAPDLVVEIVSPSSGSDDAVRKRDLYARFGVQEYWLVWPAESRIDVLDLATGAETRGLGREDVLTSDRLPGFALDVAAVFARRG